MIGLARYPQQQLRPQPIRQRQNKQHNQDKQQRANKLPCASRPKRRDVHPPCVPNEYREKYQIENTAFFNTRPSQLHKIDP